MANWQGVGNQLTQGFQIGQQTGGRLKGLGTAIAKVAAGLKSKRETGEALGTLGQTERIKQQIKSEFTPTPEYKPKTQEEALAYETAKAGILKQPQAIVDARGKTVGERPAGSVFQPKEDLVLKYLMGGDTPKKSFIKSPYPEYPDAFQEDGVWKVKKGNKKYRIE